MALRAGVLNERGPLGREEPPALARAAAGRRRLWLPLALGLAVVLLVAGAVAALVPGVRHESARRTIARVRYERHEIQALDDAGQRIWSHSFDLPLAAGHVSQFPSPRYLLFPPSEINRAVGLPYNRVLAIWPGPAGIEVETMEGLDSQPERATQSFLLSYGFALERASQSDSWATHELLEREGKIRHAVAECPMYRTPPPVRAWDPANGWRALQPRKQAAVAVGPRAAGP